MGIMEQKKLDAKERQKEYSERVHNLNLVEGWWWDSEFKPRPDQPTQPQTPAIAYMCKWSDLEPLVHQMADVIGLGQGRGKAERRALIHRNPGLAGKYGITNSFYADCQIVQAGEVAPSHTHTTTAARFIYSGKGGWTCVEGERVMLAPGDLVINQQMGWHDHGNDGPDELIFVNILDIPLLTSLSTAFWDFDYVAHNGSKEKPAQALEWPLNYSNTLYQSGGIVPKFIGGTRPDHSPMLSYRWAVVRETLKRLRKEEGSAYDGIIVEFVNPATGGSVAPTMSICAQLLRPDEKLLPHRHNSNTVYLGMEGRGYTVVGDKRFDWDKYDIFAVPAWNWHHHGNESAEDAILYSVSDSPVIEKLGLYYEHRKTHDGKEEFLGLNANRLVKK